MYYVAGNAECIMNYVAAMRFLESGWLVQDTFRIWCMHRDEWVHVYNFTTYMV